MQPNVWFDPRQNDVPEEIRQAALNLPLGTEMCLRVFVKFGYNEEFFEIRTPAGEITRGPSIRIHEPQLRLRG